MRLANEEGKECLTGDMLKTGQTFWTARWRFPKSRNLLTYLRFTPSSAANFRRSFDSARAARFDALFHFGGGASRPSTAAMQTR